MRDDRSRIGRALVATRNTWSSSIPPPSPGASTARTDGPAVSSENAFIPAMRAPAKVASMSRKVTLHLVAGGNGCANSSTHVCASIQCPDPAPGQLLVAGAVAPESPSATMFCEKRMVKRSIVPLIASLVPGVAMTTLRRQIAPRGQRQHHQQRQAASPLPALAHAVSQRLAWTHGITAWREAGLACLTS
jgi:hypothetical protein